MTKTIHLTESELQSFGIKGDDLVKIKESPKLGYTASRLVDLGTQVVVQERPFIIMGEEISEISFNSCLKGVLKKGDILVSINGGYISTLQGKKIFIKTQKEGNRAYTHLHEFTKANQEVEITYLTEKRQEKSTRQSNQEPALKEVKVSVVINFVYEVTDPAIIARVERKRVIELPNQIKAKLFNQDHAVDRVFKRIKIYAAELKEVNKPIGAYLFVGPTGTGKTELSNLLAQALGFSLVRIDMSEFSEKHTISRLIGSPAGYVGYGDQTILEKEIGNDGRKVVLLLDEMEKAHWELQKLFLQAMDNSRITLANGVEINMSNVLLIMTSNLGTVTKTSMGLGNDATESLLTVDMSAIKSYFLPEFIGRLSGVVQFNSLKEEHARVILDKFIKEFNENQMERKNAFVELSNKAKDQIIAIGFDKMYGARPLKNTLNEAIYEKIADLYLYNDEHEANIEVDFIGNEFIVKFKPTETPILTLPEEKKTGLFQSILNRV